MARKNDYDLLVGSTIVVGGVLRVANSTVPHQDVQCI